MNLSKFLSSVDTLSQTMNKKQLEVFVHDIARVLPENRRIEFIEKMKNSTGTLPKENEYEKVDKIKYEEIKGELEKIEKGEICLLGVLNEEYDDWYNSVDEEFLFEDPEGIGKAIERASQFIHESIDKQLYEEGNKIAEILIGLCIVVEGEYQDYSNEPLAVEELVRYHLATISYQNLAAESLYLTYCASPLEKRADALYRMIQNAQIKDVSFEMIMQCGDELPEWKEFLPKWIAYLGTQSSQISQILLDEAVDLLDDTENLLMSARAYYEQHPGLYEKYIRKNHNKVSSEMLIQIGKEALDRIDVKYRIRSRIALMLANVVLKEKQKATEEAEEYWMEAFRSDTRVVHYLRMMMECCDFSRWQEKLQRINHDILKKGKSGTSYCYGLPTDLQENVPDINNIYLIALLNGEYKFVKEQGMNKKEALGWSASYMKIGLAAFLLFLYHSEKLSEGTNAMLSKILFSISFSTSEYGQSTLQDIAETDKELLWTCIIQSKLLNPMSESEQTSYLKWVERLVEKRVEGIMEGNYRKYYGECAGYIAALGEVMESRGIMNGKQKMMFEYKQCYSRRRAFHEELRNYGMKDRHK